MLYFGSLSTNSTRFCSTWLLIIGWLVLFCDSTLFALGLLLLRWVTLYFLMLNSSFQIFSKHVHESWVCLCGFLSELNSWQDQLLLNCLYQDGVNPGIWRCIVSEHIKQIWVQDCTLGHSTFHIHGIQEKISLFSSNLIKYNYKVQQSHVYWKTWPISFVSYS